MERITKLLGRVGQVVIGFLAFVGTSWGLLQSTGKIPGILWYGSALAAAAIWAYTVAALLAREFTATLNVSGEPQRRYRYRGWRRHALLSLTFLIPAALAITLQFAASRSSVINKGILILVADFDGPDAEYGVTESIFEELRQLEKADPELRVRSAGVRISAKDGPARAEQIARQNSAAVIVWGWYRATADGVSLNAHYQVAQDSCASYFGSDVRRIVGIFAIFRVSTSRAEFPVNL